jgi:putative SOS response-associated peptidase YedK
MRFGFTKEYSKKQTDNLSFDTSMALIEEGHNESDQLMNFFIKQHLVKVIYSFRCVIIVDAFIVSSPDNKYYLIHMQNKERPFVLAGIYDHWQNPDTGIYSTGFEILTTKSNSMLQNVGIEQMPVIISFKKVSDWLGSKQQIEKILSSIHPFPDETMNGYQVSSKIFTEPFTKEILQPIGQKFKPDLIKTAR